MFLLAAANVNADSSGLNAKAADELRDAGVDKYLGTSISTTSEYGVWTEHAFDPLYTPDATYPIGFRPDGPACIAGTEYSVFTRQGDPKKLLIFLQGGGACWQGFYNCQHPGRSTRHHRSKDLSPASLILTHPTTPLPTTRLSTCLTAMVLPLAVTMT